MANPTLLILAGDGIGPEVMAKSHASSTGSAKSVTWRLT